jgi:hypothetical protein
VSALLCGHVAAAANPGLRAQSRTEGSRWSGSAQANGSLLFGETEQRSFGARTTLARADSILEFNGSLQVLYGEASLADGGRAVVKRLWLGAVTADWRPHAIWSPFLLATAETSLEKRIASRYNVGVGVKYTALRTEQAELSLSAALLDERVLRIGSEAVSTRLTRWSTRARARYAFDDRTRLTHVTFWRPSATAFNRFIVQSSTELSLGLTRRTAVSLTFLDNYDSEAVGRGARTYNDGQLLLGLIATW